MEKSKLPCIFESSTKHTHNMPKTKYLVEWTEEVTYTIWVEADTADEAEEIVNAGNYDGDDIEESSASISSSPIVIDSKPNEDYVEDVEDDEILDEDSPEYDALVNSEINAGNIQSGIDYADQD